jgi:hypothetical protein
LNEPRRGLGRCVEVEVKRVEYVPGEGRSARAVMFGGENVYAAEFTYKARAA